MRPQGLWRHPDFLKLWMAQSISAFGSEVTSLALPLIAITLLNAGPSEMGILRAMEKIPVLLFGLLVGIWIDRIHRRPLMVATDLGRGLLLATIPLLAFLGILRMMHLYAIGFLIGILTVCFDLAVTSYLPSLIGRNDLVEGNSKIQAAFSMARVGGPGLAGVLIQLLTAPVAILVDAISFLVSGLCIWAIRIHEPVLVHKSDNQTLWQDIREGIQMVFCQPIIASLTISSTIGSLGTAIQQTVLILFLTRELMLEPVWLGVVLMSAGVASLIGTFIAGPAANLLGLGPAIIVATLMWSIGMGSLPLVKLTTWTIPALCLGQLLIGIAHPIYSINQICLRQAITPDWLLGRVNAIRRVLVFGIVPIGALISGRLGERIGLQATLSVGAIIALMGWLYLVLSPLRKVRVQPVPIPNPQSLIP